MKYVNRLLIAVCLAVVPAAVQADLIATISPTPIVAGNDIYLNVFLRSDSSDTLTSFNVSYVINQPGLQFYTISPTVPDELQLSNPEYVFYGISLAANYPPGGTVDDAKDIYTQSDSIDTSATSATYVTIGTAPELLATLHLVVVSSGTYNISVNTEDSQNGFLDRDFSPNSYVFPSMNITVTLVPEPSSLSLCVAGLAGILCWVTYSIRQCRTTGAA